MGIQCDDVYGTRELGASCNDDGISYCLGSRLDAALDKAGKAVFWKDKGAVQRQVKIWDAPSISRALTRLGQAERTSRASRNAGDVLIAQELLMIARQAARER